MVHMAPSLPIGLLRLFLVALLLPPQRCRSRRALRHRFLHGSNRIYQTRELQARWLPAAPRRSAVPSAPTPAISSGAVSHSSKLIPDQQSLAAGRIPLRQLIPGHRGDVNSYAWERDCLTGPQLSSRRQGVSPSRGDGGCGEQGAWCGAQAPAERSSPS